MSESRSEDECPFCGNTETEPVGEFARQRHDFLPDDATGDFFIAWVCEACKRDYWNAYTLSGHEPNANAVDGGAEDE